MSASRAIASAKNKKAGGNNPNPAVSTTDNQYSSNIGDSGSSPAQAITKVTIPQAIQMLSSRLDVMEEKLNKAFEALEDSRVLEQQSENKYLVDSKVFESIVGRLETLENLSFNSTIQREQKENVSKQELIDVYSNISNINNKINDFKNDFIKLQTYVMDTNSKLTEIVFSIPIESIVDYRDIFVKKNEENTDQNQFLPISRMTSTPDMSEMMRESLNMDSLERPALQRQTNQIFIENKNSDINDIKEMSSL